MIRIEGISQLRINVKPVARVDALDWRGIGKEVSILRQSRRLFGCWPLKGA
jgi:hypothetical protein